MDLCIAWPAIIMPCHVASHIASLVSGQSTGHDPSCDGLAAMCQGWLGNKEAVLHAGEGPIQTARWAGTLAAWANSVSVKVAS